MSAFRDFVAYVQGTAPGGAATQAAPAGNSAVAGPNAGAGQAGAASGGAGVPDATSTDLFFAWKSPDLTPSDKQALDSYAGVYLMAKSPKPVVVDGYASKEGDPGFNQNLSQQRADAVANYLKRKGVRVASSTGHGATGDLSPDDLMQNRRATITPPPLEHLVTGVEKPPNEKKPDPTLGEKAPEPDVPPPPPPPPETVTRAEVEAELTQFLLRLGKWQKHLDKTVVATITVSLAETRLRQGLEGEPFMKPGGDGKGYQASELAHSIAQQLPDEIPKENFDDFKKLKPEDTPQPKSTLDQFKQWFKKNGEKVLSDFGVPKELWPTIEDAVKKHARDIIDNAPVDPTVRDIMQKAYDKLIQEREDD